MPRFIRCLVVAASTIVGAPAVTPASALASDVASVGGHQSVLRAFSDTSQVADEKAAREKLESLRYSLASDREANGTIASAQSSGSGTLPPALAAQMRGMRDKAIAEIQKQIAASNPAKETEKIKQLEYVLAKTRESYASMLGEAAPAGSSPSPAAPPTTAPGDAAETGQVLRIPAYGTAQPSFSTAIVNLKKLLEANVSSDALAAFKGSADYANADRCSGSAATALLAHRELAALAALLRAQELEPKMPAHLLNLAGLTARFGLPRHALALLEAAEKMAASASEQTVINPRAVLLTTRGHALVQLGRYRDAETALRVAVQLEPGLSEAQINLAHALFQQTDDKKKTEAIALMRFARHRVAAAPAVPPDSPTPPATTNPPPKADEPSRAPAEEPSTEPKTVARSGRPLARDVFDLSHGKAGGLPTIKIPRTVADAHAMWPKVRKLQLETIADMGATAARMNALWAEMLKRERSGPTARLAGNRARDVFWYITYARLDPSLRGLYKEYRDARQDHGVGTFGGQFENPWGSRELQDELDRIRARTQPYELTCRQMYEAIEPYHATWLGPIHDLETDVNRYARRSHEHISAIAAHLSDPVHREYAKQQIKLHMLACFADFLAPLEVVCRYHYQNIESWGALKGPGTAEDVKPGSSEEPDGCPDSFKGDYSAGLNLKLFSVSINCEKVGFELSTGTWIKAFLAVDQMVDGSGAFFVGVAGDSGAMGSSGVSAVLKGGLYLCIGADGSVTDFGIKSSDTSTIGVSVAGFGASYSREIGHTFSLVAALKE